MKALKRTKKISFYIGKVIVLWVIMIKIPGKKVTHAIGFLTVPDIPDNNNSRIYAPDGLALCCSPDPNLD